MNTRIDIVVFEDFNISNKWTSDSDIVSLKEVLSTFCDNTSGTNSFKYRLNNIITLIEDSSKFREVYNDGVYINKRYCIMVGHPPSYLIDYNNNNVVYIPNVNMVNKELIDTYALLCNPTTVW